ncbi:MAG: CRTAC1 family protein [Planctomycetota bacterium]
MIALLPFLFVPATPPMVPQEKVSHLSEERQLLDKTLWSEEVQAQDHEQTFVHLWDRLRGADNPYPLLASFPFQRLQLGAPGDTETKDLGITLTRFQDGGGELLDHAAFGKKLAAFEKAGFRIVQTEWHHSGFENTAEGPARSTVSFVIHARRPEEKTRYILSGKLRVVWSEQRDSDGLFLPESLAAEGVTILAHKGFPYFVAGPVIRPPEKSQVHPLLVRDLDGDGRPEIIPAGINNVLWNRAGKMESGPLCEQLVPIFPTGLLADLTGNGHPDFFTVGRDGRPRLYPGDGGPVFRGEPRTWSLDPPVRMGSAVTAGDIDGDGDLDLWLTTYKPPYQGGAMPTPYYDANDGYPSYLLVNDGRGNFTDKTREAGLAAKRLRRTYSASFFDLDGDGPLDLVVVSDFSGVDLYHNDGHGHFTEVTTDLLPETHTFGMAHALADFNGDGRLDLFVAGMGSTTARRLEQMGLGRSDFRDRTRKRIVMGYGNRMYLLGKRRYEEAPFQDRVARTGWSWGTVAFDFDNDGDRDLYIANGHRSGKSAKDYCTTFWRHDIYTGSSKPDPAVKGLMDQVLAPLKNQEISWNGFEHNNLLMNESGRDFTNIAFLMGLAKEFDSRGVAAADLDADGRPDLLVIQRQEENGVAWQTLHVYLNRGDTGNHWIGVRLKGRPGISPIGARVVLRTPRRTQVHAVVTGDSFEVQQPFSALFGLGKETAVDSVEIFWPDGSTTRLDNPDIDQYHAIAPARG